MSIRLVIKQVAPLDQSYPLLSRDNYPPARATFGKPSKVFRDSMISCDVIHERIFQPINKVPVCKI